MKAGKVVLIGCGAAAILGIVLLIAGFTLLIYLTPQEFANSYDDGKEFGKTTDLQGCMKRSLERAKETGPLSLMENTTNGQFVSGCFETAKGSSDFCKGVPGMLSDSVDRWRDEECRSAGLNIEATGCRTVMDKKLFFCAFGGK